MYPIERHKGFGTKCVKLKNYKQAHKTQNNNARSVSIHKNLNQLILYYVNA